MKNEFRIKVSWKIGYCDYNTIHTVRAKTEQSARFEAMSMYCGPRVTDLKADVISAIPCFD